MIIMACSKNRGEMLAEHIQQHVNVKVVFITEKNQLTNAYLESLGYKPKFIFFPYWSYIVPAEIYNHYQCIIFHMTDVPFGRGGSPLQNLISRGIYETKISAIRCVKELDAGPVYLKRPLSLHGNAKEIYHRASQVIIEMIIEIFQNNLKPVKQKGDAVVFARRKPSESNISSLTELHKIHDYIRMLDADGYPKAFIETENFRLEFSRSSFNGQKIVADVTITRKEDSSE